MRKLKAVICGWCFLLFAVEARATLIDHGDYLTDTATGYDWLDVTKTLGQSYDSVLTQLGVGGALAGWRYATGVEFNTLIADHTGFQPPANLVFFNYNVGNNITGLMSWLGITTSSNDDTATLGILADDRVGFPTNRWAAYIHDSLADDPQIPDSTLAHGLVLFDWQADDQVGSFLVRAQPRGADIPEPSTLSLLALSLGVLALRRSRQRALGKA